jgi:hypothetical protein
MRPRRVRFTIRWLMEVTAIVAIALSSLRFSVATWFFILYLLTLYVFGLAPLRRLYGFAPLRRLFAKFTCGYLQASSDGRVRDDTGACNGWTRAPNEWVAHSPACVGRTGPTIAGPGHVPRSGRHAERAGYFGADGRRGGRSAW